MVGGREKECCELIIWWGTEKTFGGEESFVPQAVLSADRSSRVVSRLLRLNSKRKGWEMLTYHVGKMDRGRHLRGDNVVWRGMRWHYWNRIEDDRCCIWKRWIKLMISIVYEGVVYEGNGYCIWRSRIELRATGIVYEGIESSWGQQILYMRVLILSLVCYVLSVERLYSIPNSENSPHPSSQIALLLIVESRFVFSILRQTSGAWRHSSFISFTTYI